VAALLEITPTQVGLAWLLAHDPSVLLIPGTSGLEHLEDNVAVDDIPCRSPIGTPPAPRRSKSRESFTPVGERSAELPARKVRAAHKSRAVPVDGINHASRTVSQDVGDLVR